MGAETLAAVAGAAAVLGAWDALTALAPARGLPALQRVLDPLARARHEGREPTRAERRRLALLATGVLGVGAFGLGGAMLAAVACTGGPAVALSALRARRRRYGLELAKGAAPAARAMADALGVGRSVPAAVEDAGRRVPGAAGVELRVVAAAVALGTPLDAALERLRARARAASWDVLVAAVALQREAGGDLARLLRDLAGSLEAAARAEADARAATAQARFTAWVVLALPAAAAALTELAAPGFLGGLLARPLPAALVTGAVALQAVAVLAIRRLVRAP